MRPPIALTIAGSDSSGGAGIQADLKTFTALGVYGASALTALTAQNTQGVQDVLAVGAPFVAAQIRSVLDDVPIDATKIGMLGGEATVEILADLVAERRRDLGRIVLDPVMVATSGDPLLSAEGARALRERLVPLADVLTPNLPEAARLLGRMAATDATETVAQGQALAAMGPGWVLMKGGHAEGGVCTDRLIGPEARDFTAPRLLTRNTHGTGCTLSAAIAAGLAQGRLEA